MNLKERIFNAIPTNPKEAKTINEIASSVESSWATVKQNIKALRLEWAPILWNSRWSYVSYDQKEISNHINKCGNMIRWYSNWMNRIISSLK